MTKAAHAHCPTTPQRGDWFETDAGQKGYYAHDGTVHVQHITTLEWRTVRRLPSTARRLLGQGREMLELASSYTLRVLEKHKTKSTH